MAPLETLDVICITIVRDVVERENVVCIFDICYELLRAKYASLRDAAA